MERVLEQMRIQMEVGERVKTRARKRPCGENKEKAPGTCFPFQEENLRLPSSAEVCRSDIGSSTLCVPLRHGGGDIYIYIMQFVW